MSDKLTIDCVIGIDPGGNGGIAVFIPGRPVRTLKMPKDMKDLRVFLSYYCENFKPIVFLEKLSVRPDDVSVDESGQTNMGKLFRVQKMIANYEQLKATIEMTGIPYILTHPMTWQTKLKLRIKGSKEEKADRKRRYADYATSLHYVKRATLWNADALLILHFGRWVLVNEPDWVRANLPKREHDKLFE